MNILKIVNRLSELFGERYFAEGSISRLSGPPNVIKKNRYKNIRWNSYLKGMVVAEDPVRLKPGNDALTLDVRSAKCQIDIHYILLAFGVFILVLFGIAGLKMKRKKERKPTCTKIGQKDEDEVFFDCKKVFPDFQFKENKVFVDFQKGFQYEMEWIIELQPNKKQVISKLLPGKKQRLPEMPSNEKEGLNELKSRKMKQSDKEFLDLPSDKIQRLTELESIKKDLLYSKSANNQEYLDSRVRNLKCKKKHSKSCQYVEWGHFRRLTDEECLMPPQVD